MTTHSSPELPMRATAAPLTTNATALMTRLIAQIAVVAVGFEFRFAASVTPGLLIAALFAPVLIGAVRRYRLGPMLFTLGGLAVLSGLVLAELAALDRQIDTTNRNGSIGLLLSGFAAIAVILLAREYVSIHRVVLLFGIGALGHALLFGEMSWKFDLALPTIFVVLGLLGGVRNRLVPAAAVLALGFLAVLDEGRSIFGFCLIAAALTVWQTLRQSRTAPTAGRRWLSIVLLVGLPVLIYFATTSLLTSGAFGPVLQERSVAQIDATGSLIAGGRPEWAATRELVQLNPQGYGLGVVPSWNDLEAGRAGLTSINVDTGGYVNNYMFGGEFNLHSVAAELWVSYGWVGVALAATLLFAIVRNLVFQLAERRAPTALILAAALAIWYLLFGPIYSNWLEVCVAVGLLLEPRAAPRDKSAGSGTAGPDIRPEAAR